MDLVQQTKNKTMEKKLSITVIGLFLYFIFSYIFNFIKFVRCDFEPSYKEEIIYALGVFVPPLNFLTVWY